jgi:hypothetical protein
MAYVTETQLAFKESYYGYTGAIVQWRQLQSAAPQGGLLREHFAWVKDEARVGPCGLQGVVPLAVERPDGGWSFRTHGLSFPSVAAIGGQRISMFNRMRSLVRNLRARLRPRRG